MMQNVSSLVVIRDQKIRHLITSTSNAVQPGHGELLFLDSKRNCAWTAGTVHKKLGGSLVAIRVVVEVLYCHTMGIFMIQNLESSISWYHPLDGLCRPRDLMIFPPRSSAFSCVRQECQSDSCHVIMMEIRDGGILATSIWLLQ